MRTLCALLHCSAASSAGHPLLSSASEPATATPEPPNWEGATGNEAEKPPSADEWIIYLYTYRL